MRLIDLAVHDILTMPSKRLRRVVVKAMLVAFATVAAVWVFALLLAGLMFFLSRAIGLQP